MSDVVRRHDGAGSRDMAFVVLRRTGAPPLRLKAALISRHARKTRSGGTVCTLSLFARPTKGYAVELCSEFAPVAATIGASEDEGRGTQLFDAAWAKDLLSAIELCEEMVTRMAADSVAKRDGLAAAPWERLADHARNAEFRETLLQLAGTSFCEWMSLEHSAGYAAARA